MNSRETRLGKTITVALALLAFAGVLSGCAYAGAEPPVIETKALLSDPCKFTGKYVTPDGYLIVEKEYSELKTSLGFDFNLNPTFSVKTEYLTRAALYSQQNISSTSALSVSLKLNNWGWGKKYEALSHVDVAGYVISGTLKGKSQCYINVSSIEPFVSFKPTATPKPNK